MTVRLSCRAGHEWETVENALAVSTVCPVCGDSVSAADTAAGGSLGPSSDTESFVLPGDDLPPLPQAPSALDSTVHFAKSETIETSGDGPVLPGYRIVRELGRGGMGIVYLANHTSLNRLVAVKLVRAGVDADDPEIDRFRAEAQAVASLQHPNVVQVFEVGTHEGRPYFTQEYLGGGDLSGKIGGTPWPPHKAAELVETLARAVRYAHDRGIVHRDLKPANILFANGSWESRSGDESPDASADASLPDLATAKITDFGIAKRLDARSDRTKTGMIIGTPSYMAPEQAAGMSKDVGPRADVYALGAILYELLTGRPPFKAATATETLHQVVHDDPIPPARLVPRTPRDVETICLKCLEKSPARRYACARELADDLRRFQDGEPILARPVSRWERLRKWCRRRPAAAALLGVLGAGLTSAAVFTLQYNRAVTQERNKALQGQTEAEVARAASVRHFGRAIDAVDQMLNRLGMERLESVPHMDDTRRQLLEDALAFYLEFLSEEGEDTQLRAEAAQIAERTGYILLLMGRFEEARVHYLKSLDWQEEYLTSHKGEPILPHLAGGTRCGLGWVYYRTGHINEARKEFLTSLSHRQSLAQSEPENPDYRYDVSDTQVCLAQVEQTAGRHDLVISYLEEAVTACESLVQEFPDDGRYAFVLGRARNLLGEAYVQTQRPQEALKTYEKNVQHWQSQIRTRPSDPWLQSGLARSLAHLAQIVLQESNDQSRAHELHLEALKIRERLEIDHPEIVAHAIQLAQSYLYLGRLSYLQEQHEACRQWCTKSIDKLQSVQSRTPQEPGLNSVLYTAHFFRFASAENLRQFEEGLVDVEKLIELDDGSEIGRLRLLRILYLARLGRHRDAQEAFASIAENTRSTWDGDAYYGLACAWSHCASAAEGDASMSSSEKDELIAQYAALSLEMLENARKAGRLATDDQRQSLAADPELAWIRGRDEFQVLLERISKPEEPRK